MGNLDLRTEKQRERDKKHDRIVKAFTTLREKNPDAGAWTIFYAMEREIGMSATGIAKVCQKNGCYQPSK